MRPKTLEYSLNVLAIAILAMAFAFPYLGFHGFRGDMHKFIPRLSVGLSILVFIIGRYVNQERRKIEAIHDDTTRNNREQNLAKKIYRIAVAFILALFCGYLIGRLF